MTRTAPAGHDLQAREDMRAVGDEKPLRLFAGGPSSGRRWAEKRR